MLRNGDPIIIDFGYCEVANSHKPNKKYNVGSPAYMSPEAYLESSYSHKSDIWALGVIFHEMLTGEVLDEVNSMKKFFENFKTGGVKFNFRFDNNDLEIL